MRNAPRILIAGIGNIFLGDDAFGVEVAQRLLRRELPEGVQAADFGIRGLDLAYALMDGYDAAILVDAMSRGGEPGTMYLLEPDMAGETRSPGMPAVDPHAMHPERVLALVRDLGGCAPRILILGCEPATLGDGWEGDMGLSPAVEAAVEGAIRLIESRVALMMEESRSRVPA